jgi:hypothetical protein
VYALYIVQQIGLSKLNWEGREEAIKGGGYEKYWSVLCIRTYKRQRKSSLMKNVRQNRRRGDEGG